MKMSRKIKIGTRKSPLAMAQAGWVADALAATTNGTQGAIEVEIVPLVTRGDKITARPLPEIGGKGLFTQELETALHDGTLDLAVHSLKDLPTQMPDGLMLACTPPRENAQDALIVATAGGAAGENLAGLPEAATVGTSSLRRQAQILRARPDIRIIDLRGNLATRLEKLAQGADGLQAIVLAMAGLNRLGLAAKATEILPPEIMLPAAGQGALAVQCRADDTALHAWLKPLHCPITHFCITAERKFLATLGGNCQTPMAALATMQEDRLTLTARLMSEDGTDIAETRHEEKLRQLPQAEAIGAQAGAAIKSKAAHLLPPNPTASGETL